MQRFTQPCIAQIHRGELTLGNLTIVCERIEEPVAIFVAAWAGQNAIFGIGYSATDQAGKPVALTEDTIELFRDWLDNTSVGDYGICTISEVISIPDALVSNT